MSPRHHLPAIEAVAGFMEERFEPKPALAVPGGAPKDGLSDPDRWFPSGEEPDCDSRHHMPSPFTRRHERRGRTKSESGSKTSAVIASQILRPASEQSSRRRTRYAEGDLKSRDSASSPFLPERDDERRSGSESEEDPAGSSRPGYDGPPTMFNPAALSLLAPSNHRSGSSSGSGSTVTASKYKHDGEGGASRKPDALSFLDPDSPAVTEEAIRRTMAEAATQWHGQDICSSPRSASSSSSASSRDPDSLKSDGSSERDTEPSTSPEQSVNGDIVSTTFTQVAPSILEYATPLDKAELDAKTRTARRQRQPQPQPQPQQQHGLSRIRDETKKHRYGTPEMPRGNANLPHLPPNALTPRVSNPGHGHVKHLPRAEKLPLTGYELLAERLSSHPNMPPSRPHRRGSRYSEQGDMEGCRPTSKLSGDHEPISPPYIKPMYRRFEALNHRLLLHLQDELSELEEQLHRLDTTDTQTRRLQNRILPASRRAEHMAGGELQWHKTDILGKIGFKLGQYNHVLSSFTATQNLPGPSLSDVQTYRTYLATHNPIAEIETRFLDSAADLVSLAPRRPRRPSSSASDSDSNGLHSAFSDGAPTPTPRKARHFGGPDGDSLASASPRDQDLARLETAGEGTIHVTTHDIAKAEAAASPPKHGLQQSGPLFLMHIAVLVAAVAVTLTVVPLLVYRVVGGFAVGAGAVVLLGTVVVLLEHNRRRGGMPSGAKT